jgi:hypothetical protein
VGRRAASMVSQAKSDDLTELAIRRAMKSFENEECHKRWNNKNCDDIQTRRGNRIKHARGKRK